MADQNPTPPASGSADPEGQRVKALDDRFSAIENKQREQDGVLQKILGHVEKGGAAPAAGDGPAGGAQGQGNIAAQVREEIAAADKRREQENAAKNWREAVTSDIEALKKEHKPREPETGVRGRIQKALFGGQP